MFQVEYNDGDGWRESGSVFEGYEEAVETARTLWDMSISRVRVVDRKGNIPFYRGRAGTWFNCS